MRQLIKTFSDEIILQALMVNKGSVSKAAAQLNIGVGRIYRLLKNPDLRKRLSAKVISDVIKGWQKLIDLLDSSDEQIQLGSARILLQYGGHVLGLSQTAKVETISEIRSGVMQTPMPVVDEAEWQKQAQAYYKQRQAQIEISQESEDEEPEDEYLKELNFENDDPE